LVNRHAHLAAQRGDGVEFRCGRRDLLGESETPSTVLATLAKDDSKSIATFVTAAPTATSGNVIDAVSVLPTSDIWRPMPFQSLTNWSDDFDARAIPCSN
jgi:hypothetical protein